MRLVRPSFLTFLRFVASENAEVGLDTSCDRGFRDSVMVFLGCFGLILDGFCGLGFFKAGTGVSLPANFFEKGG